MTGDMSNAELGVSETDAVGAGRRFNEKQGFQKQQDWSLAYMNERIVSSIGVVLLFFILFVWLFDIPKYISYGVTISAIVIGCILIWSFMRQRLCLLDQRRKQVGAIVSSKKNR